MIDSTNYDNNDTWTRTINSKNKVMILTIWRGITIIIIYESYCIIIDDYPMNLCNMPYKSSNLGRSPNPCRLVRIPVSPRPVTSQCGERGICWTLSRKNWENIAKKWKDKYGQQWETIYGKPGNQMGIHLGNQETIWETMWETIYGKPYMGNHMGHLMIVWWLLDDHLIIRNWPG